MRFFLFITALLLTACISVDALEAGAAKVDITGPIGTPLSGYGARMGRDSIAVHDPIWARALYLDDGETRLFLVSVDLIGIMPELRQRVLELATEVVPPENIILTATHTHSAQGATTRNILIRFVAGRYIPEVLEQTAQGIVDAMRNAYDKRKRAALGYAAGKQEGLSANRRYPDGPVDNQVGVISVEDADGNPISIITNFAAHPTSIEGDDFFSFSADYPGYYYLEMEALRGPECVPIFLNGAQGNQTTGNPEGKSGWERTESVGRLLARRANEIAEGIAFSDVKFRIANTNARLPLTLMDNLLPEQVFLQSLEINDLLINFFPGEACVELALEARRRALEHGYAAHFSVGLTNNHLMYFAPRHLYPDPTYESSSTFFGPGIEDWFYTQFEGMMSRKPAEEAEETAAPAPESPLQEIPGGGVLTLTGTPHEIGKLRGELFGADIQQRYKTRVIEPVEDGRWLPESGMMSYIPSFLETRALALPVLGMGSRSLLQGLSLDIIQEMEGMAEGARLPFDAFWLLQHAPLYDQIDDKTPLFAAPLCTMFAVVGERAGSAGLMVGRNLDWAMDEENIITRVFPEKGNPFIQAGFTWNEGVYTAMNGDGLVLCVQRLETAPVLRPEKAPIEFVLRDIIQSAKNYEEALERLRQSKHISGVYVLVAGFSDDKPKAAVVEFGKSIVVREPEDGLLLGMHLDAPGISDNERSRYAKVAALLAEMPAVNEENMKTILKSTDDDSPKTPAMSNVWNDMTKHSVVFLPKSDTILVAMPSVTGEPGDYVTIPISGEISHE